MACFMLIVVDENDVAMSTKDTFDSTDSNVSIDLFKRCLVDEGQHFDDIFASAEAPTHNRRTDIVSMVHDNISYLFFMN